MKQVFLFLVLIQVSALGWLFPQTSSIEYQPGTHLEVTAGADISTDAAMINGTFSGGGTLNGGPLPVELVSFHVQTDEDRVLLNWVTATEISNYGFTIQRREGNRKPEADEYWLSVGFVHGNGNSNAPKKYNFIDNNVPNGEWIYRLRQADNDGSVTYSFQVMITVGGIPVEFALKQNYPNPFNPNTVIEFALPKDETVSLKVYNAIGEIVAELVNGKPTAGYHSTIWDASSVPSGIYYCRISAGEYSSVKKMMLVK